MAPCYNATLVTTTLQADDIEELSTSKDFVVEAYQGGRNQIGAEYIIRV